MQNCIKMTLLTHDAEALLLAASTGLIPALDSNLSGCEHFPQRVNFQRAIFDN